MATRPESSRDDMARYTPRPDNGKLTTYAFWALMALIAAALLLEALFGILA